MKKYLLGAMAIILAVGLNSFTLMEKKNTAGKKFALLYWYKVDAFNKVTSSLGHVDRSTLIPATCPNSGTVNCARGYNVDPHPAIGSTAPASDDDIRKTN